MAWSFRYSWCPQSFTSTIPIRVASIAQSVDHNWTRRRSSNLFDHAALDTVVSQMAVSGSLSLRGKLTISLSSLANLTISVQFT